MKIVTLIMIGFLVCVISTGCSYWSNETHSHEHGDQPPIPSHIEKQGSQQKKLAQKSQGDRVNEREETSDEEKSDLDSKVKAVDDFFRVLGNILN